MGLPFSTHFGFNRNTWDDNTASTTGIYTTVSDNSCSWNNNIETGIFMQNERAVGDRTSLGIGLKFGYAQTDVNSDIESENAEKKNNFVFGAGLNGTYALNKNFTLTGAISGHTQSYGQDRQPYSDELHLPEENNPEYYAAKFQYDKEAYKYNRDRDEYNDARNAWKGSASLGIEFTGNKGIFNGGLRGVATTYSGYGENQQKGINMSAEVYTRLKVSDVFSVGATVSTNKTASAGICVTF